MIKNFSHLVKQVKSEKQKTIAVAKAEDVDILNALEKARSLGLAKAILIGNRTAIVRILKKMNIKEDLYQIVPTSDEIQAIKVAIDFVRNGKAHVLMKGLCSTANFLKGILDKANGLRSKKVISHLAVFESPNYHKLFMMSDAAINIAPDLSTKIATCVHWLG